MLLNCCIQYANKFDKLGSGHWKTGKSQFSFQSQRRAMPKNVQVAVQLHPITSKLMLKIFKLDFKNTWTENFQMYKLDLEKAEEPGIKLPTSTGSWKTYTLLTMLKPLTVWITTNCEIFLKRCEYQTTLPASWETCMQDKKQLLELHIGQWTGFKLGKEYIKAVYRHPAI